MPSPPEPQHSEPPREVNSYGVTPLRSERLLPLWTGRKYRLGVPLTDDASSERTRQGAVSRETVAFGSTRAGGLYFLPLLTRKGAGEPGPALRAQRPSIAMAVVPAHSAGARGETRCFTSFGVRLGVTAMDPRPLRRLDARIPPMWRRSSSGRFDRLYTFSCDGRGVHTLSVGAETIAKALALEPVFEALEVDARHYVAEFAPRRVFVHAGTVAVDGRAVVIPGRSGTGKSTLVAALVRCGATYYSDEYAVFDRRGCVHAYLKPISLRTMDGSKAPANIDDLGHGHCPPVPLGAVVVGGYGGSDTCWQPRIDSGAGGMMALVDNTVAVRRQPERTLKTLAGALPGVIVLSGARGEADRSAEELLRRLRGRW